MNQKIKKISNEINLLNERIEQLKETERLLKYDMKDGHIYFDNETIERHKNSRVSIFSKGYISEVSIYNYLVIPFIVVIIIPTIFLDILVTIYQTINFPVYKISKVKRSEYIIFDRHQLNYLNILEKSYCLYCSYFNGLIAYVSEIGARTEQYWCPIKHARKAPFHHSRYMHFSEYGDEDYPQKLANFRSKL